MNKNNGTSLKIEILFVEDEAAIRDVLLKFLEIYTPQLGVDCAVNGREALIKWNANTGKYPIVITDYDLGDMEGKEIIQKIRETSRIPIILISGRDENDPAVQTILQTSGTYFMHKPPEKYDQLSNLVKEILSL